MTKKEYDAKRYQENKELFKLKAKNYRLVNIEKISEYNKSENGKARHIKFRKTKKYKDWCENNKTDNLKIYARHQADYYIKNKKPCVICKTILNIHKHHWDYKNPLSVVFMCSSHHNDLHLNNLKKDDFEIYKTELNRLIELEDI